MSELTAAEPLATPNATTRVQVRASDLPVHCPLPGSALWCSHPRVFIPLESVGDQVVCPYCGTRFELIE